jgi:hypothetical protein
MMVLESQELSMTKDWRQDQHHFGKQITGTKLKNPKNCIGLESSEGVFCTLENNGGRTQIRHCFGEEIKETMYM